ncbi:MAG: SGNH/GDSL hydrolase family protein [Phycisphaerales bacterium]|nr:SGNH/GDSL hydrolase family protein [Phycisphaerales bacterium]
MLADFKKSCFAIVLAALVLSYGLAQLPRICRGQTVLAPPGRHVARESIEWIRLWLPNVVRPQLSHKVMGQYGKGKGWGLHPAVKKSLPQVLLIGDSITEMYYRDVAADLKGKACVGYMASSLCIGDPMLPAQIKLVLQNYRFNVIQFNNGMHGAGYSEAEYGKYFPRVIKTIQANDHGAKLIWANTTPTRMGKQFAVFSPWNNRIIARNKIADAYCKKAGIPINNLYDVLLHHPEYYATWGGGVHEGPKGQAAEAKKVAAAILKQIDALKPA